MTPRISGCTRSSGKVSRCIQSRISSPSRVAVKEPGVVEMVLNSRPRCWWVRLTGYQGVSPREISRANIFECRHSSSISVSAYRTCALVAALS
ncbi:hypothetical protein SGLAM104S_02868 [Streptomyces glaucescens]